MDALIHRKGESFTTNVFREETFSGVYSNFNSFMPKSYKCSLILSLLFRLFNIVSDPDIFIEEVKKLKEILMKNAYPYHLIDNYIIRFHKNRNSIATTNDDNTKRSITIILPYLGSISSRLQSKLGKLYKKSLPNFKVMLVNKTSFRIGNLFRFKDSCPESIMSHINYLYKCSSCNAAYVGKTYRHKKVRICEHMGISPRTGKTVKGVITTAVRDHMLHCDTVVCEGDFSILSKGGDYRELEIKESIMIQKLKPSLNRDLMSTPLYLFK